MLPAHPGSPRGGFPRATTGPTSGQRCCPADHVVAVRHRSRPTGAARRRRGSAHELRGHLPNDLGLRRTGAFLATPGNGPPGWHGYCRLIRSALATHAPQPGVRAGAGVGEHRPALGEIAKLGIAAPEDRRHEPRWHNAPSLLRPASAALERRHVGVSKKSTKGKRTARGARSARGRQEQSRLWSLAAPAVSLFTRLLRPLELAPRRSGLASQLVELRQIPTYPGL